MQQGTSIFLPFSLFHSISDIKEIIRSERVSKKSSRHLPWYIRLFIVNITGNPSHSCILSNVYRFIFSIKKKTSSFGGETTPKMRLVGSLISTRCIVTIGHFVALVLLFSTIGNNIVVTISREGGSQSLAVSQTTAALIVGVFCFAVDVISGIVMGHSLFHPVVCYCFLMPLMYN